MTDNELIASVLFNCDGAIYAKHDWYTDEDGSIDVWRVDSGIHNGPECKRCGYSFCHHCNSDGYGTKCYVEITDYVGATDTNTIMSIINRLQELNVPVYLSDAISIGAIKEAALSAALAYCKSQI